MNFDYVCLSGDRARIVIGNYKLFGTTLLLEKTLICKPVSCSDQCDSLMSEYTNSSALAMGLLIKVTSKCARWRLKSPAPRLFTQPLIQAKIKEIVKALRHSPLRGEFTGDRWIPRTKGQWRGKCFHLTTSSCRNWAALSPHIYQYLTVSYQQPTHGWKKFMHNLINCFAYQWCWYSIVFIMMTSWHKMLSVLLTFYGRIYWQFPPQRVSNVKLWCFLVVSLNKLLNKQ